MAVLAPALPYIAAAGTALSAVQQYQAGQAQADALRQQQQQMQASANLQAAQQEKVNKAFRSRQLAQISKAGVALEGSPLTLVQRTIEEQEIDVLTQKYNTQVGLSDLQTQEEMASYGAQAAATESLFRIPTILGTAAQSGGSDA